MGLLCGVEAFSLIIGRLVVQLVIVLTGAKIVHRTYLVDSLSPAQSKLGM